jgi:GNAT superfamily N-acetyltransferase
MGQQTDSGSPVTTRLAVAADEARIEALLCSYREELHLEASGPLPRLEIESALRVILAEREGQIIGMLAAQRYHDLAQSTQLLLLSDIFVVKEHRQRGVAKALIRACKDLHQQLHCQGMRLIVPDFNIPALTTAARAGFSRQNDLLLSYIEE